MTRALAQPESSAAHRAAVCRANVAHLAARGVDLRDALAVRAAGPELRPAPAGDHRGAALRFAEEHLPAGAPLPPVTIEGLDPPWLALAVHARIRASGSAPGEAPPNGYAPAIRIVQEDPQELLDGLAHADLAELIADPRVTFFVGPGAADSYRSELTGRADYAVLGLLAANTGLRTRTYPALGAVYAEVGRMQARRRAELEARARELYAGRDRAWWSRRFDAALDGRADPLRVLVVSCRFSSYVRHANDDLAAALARAGCVARVLIEPDDHTRFTPAAYLAEVVVFAPDLVVLVNYTRAAMEGLPAHVPFACWLQDAMPHHLTAATWRVFGDLDYVCGLVPESVTASGFPAQRVFTSWMPACGVKFHDGAIAAPQRESRACELLFATRHSETPEELHERRRRDLAPAGAAPLADALFPAVRALVEDADPAPLRPRIEALVRDALRRCPCGLDAERGASVIMDLYALPIADRVLRHQSLAWAADLAARRGWRLALHGAGWERHPRFAAHARGELAHGEPLRAAYQAAAVTLHASIHGVMHQRVIECALSGGLPVCRRLPEEILAVRHRLKVELARSAAPRGRSEERRATTWAVADHPAALRCIALHQRMGEPYRGAALVYAGDGEIASLAAAAPPAPRDCPDWLLVDLAETTFRDPAGLEEVVERAVARPRRRAGISRAIARRVRRRYSTESFAADLLAHVRGDLAGAGSTRRASAP